MLKLILLSSDRVNIGRFMKVAEIVKKGFNNTSFTATKKASNMAISVSRFIIIHKLRCHIILQLLLLYYFGVCKGGKSFGKQ